MYVRWFAGQISHFGRGQLHARGQLIRCHPRPQFTIPVLARRVFSIQRLQEITRRRLFVGRNARRALQIA